MAYVISAELCISCGTCAEVCPEEAISEGADCYVIDPELCIDCAACVDECSEGAISEA